MLHHNFGKSEPIYKKKIFHHDISEEMFSEP